MRWSFLIILGVALWAVPASSQVADWFKAYLTDGTAPGEGNLALANGTKLCPPHADYCTGPDQAHHHILSDGGTYQTDVLDVHNCKEVVFCVKTSDTDGNTPGAYIQSVSNDAGANATRILADVNGDGVINPSDEVPLDGDSGSDNDGDGTGRQTMCMYGITGHNKVRADIADDGLASGAPDDAYIELSCR